MHATHTSQWGRALVTSGQETSLKVGPVRLEISRDADTWYYRIVDDSDVTKWRTVIGCDAMTVRPAFPDLPVIIVPTEPVCVLRSALYSFVLPVDPWVQLVAERKGRPPEVVLDIPTARLHRVWFGSSEHGEPAYQAPFDPFAPGESPDGVHISVQIQNSSPSALWFEQIAVRVNELDVGTLGHELVSNPVTIVFKGTDQLSTVNVGSFAAGKKPTVVTPRRVTGGNDLIRKSFVFLRELTG